MDSTRISLARVLELGVQVSWREAAAIVHEAVALTGPTKGARPTSVTADACILTRGGEIVLQGAAAKARPETMVRLLEDLLPACDSPGGLGAALERGTALAFLEELSQRTTAKRRRVEIASVAIRALAAEADRQPHFDDDALPADALEPAVPPLPAQLTPQLPEPTPVSATPALAGATATMAAPALKVVPPPAHTDPPHAVHEFNSLRADIAARQEAANTFSLQALLDRLRALDARKVAAVAVPTVLFTAWWFWPAGPLQLPGRPQAYAPTPITAIALIPGWADIDRLGRVARRSVTAAVAPTGSAPSADASTVPPVPAVGAEPPADAAVALVSPNGDAPTAPVAAPPATATASAPATATLPAPAPATPRNVAAPNAAETIAADAVYSWTSQGVEPPVIRSPAMPSWAMPAPGAAVEGPYLEVLVDPQGQVETVRVRGRVEAGETFYRHRMMLASAKLWQFTPARLNGRPVRYVTRVVIEQP